MEHPVLLEVVPVRTAMPRCTTLFTPNPQDAMQLDWLEGYDGCDVIVGVMNGPLGGTSVDEASLQHSVCSASQELALMSEGRHSDFTALVVIVMNRPAVPTELAFLNKVIGLSVEELAAPHTAGAPRAMQLFYRLVDDLDMFPGFPHHGSGPLSNTEVLLLIPCHTISEDAAWSWFLHGVVARARPR